VDAALGCGGIVEYLSETTGTTWRFTVVGVAELCEGDAADAGAGAGSGGSG
jgi:hypothetical protein